MRSLSTHDLMVAPRDREHTTSKKSSKTRGRILNNFQKHELALHQATFTPLQQRPDAGVVTPCAMESNDQLFPAVSFGQFLGQLQNISSPESHQPQVVACFLPSLNLAT